MKTDVLILGAGPAGSALARQLASTGCAVVIADKKDFPREKPCGEFLSPQCQPLLENLGLHSLLTDLGSHLVTGMRIHGGAATAAGSFRKLPSTSAPATGFAIRREVFDHALLNAAEQQGAKVLLRHEFKTLLRDHDGRVTGATLRTPDGALVTCRATWVVGADGVHSRVARELNVQRQIEWLQQFALVTHFDGVPPMDTAEVHLLRGGFFAATTVDDSRFSLNLVLPKQALKERGERSWDEFAASHLTVAPHLQERLRDATRTKSWRGIGPFAYRTTTATVPGAALVGDAAGYVDPMTGEGIYFALFGANALGTAIRAALDHPEREAAAMATYRTTRHRELNARLCSTKAMQRGLRSPWLVRRFLGAISKWPSVADLVVTLSGDTIHPRQLWKPSFWRDFRKAAN
ncbi:MAG: flavin-dependent dehydrogenase [Planctomycetota bacterium]|jgi:flavin-dependent dehydrogenase